MIYISICIPTKDRINNLIDTINSILDDNVDPNYYQIVISDNSDNNATQEYINTFQNTNYNFKYYRNPVKGFYNSIQALLIGDGELLKLHNDYTKFKPGCFKKLVEMSIEKHKVKPLMFFPNGELKGKKENFDVKSFNRFMSKSSYLTTWSSAFSIWKSDLHNLETSPESVDIMFPHTTLLLNSNNNSFFICNEILFTNTEVKNKGGYNIYYNFCVLYLDMLKENKRLSRFVYKKIKIDMYFKFILVWYYRTVINNDRNYTFDNSNAREYIENAYGILGFKLITLLSNLKKLKDALKNKK
ncbi:glycosyltransferase [Providencia vermicola]|uniref:glycosyltransferase n=2 Tax=Morganellaceae TaxID=1903414 RepID=UPI00234B1B3E|nr:MULTISPECIES: glycosyltransferase [unclassified Providencia]